MTTVHGLSLHRAVVENDMGEGGCDTVMQGCFSFRNYWIQNNVERARNFCNCPGLIIAISGPWMVILGAVFVEYPVIQPLTDTFGSVFIHQQIRNCSESPGSLALRCSLQSLDSYYTNLNIPSDLGAPANIARFFPYIQSYLRY